VAAEVRDAATVMLVRDGDDGLEVFMVRRNLRSDFVGGAHVFPGGAVDPADGDADVQAVCAGRTDAEASAALGVRSGGLAYWVAAIRECFEEAGVLLAYGPDGAVVRLDDPDVGSRFARHRIDVVAGRRRLPEVCAEESLRLAVDALHYFSHWITPLGAPRRYDTRFFVTAAPEWQVPLHDHGETVASTWIAPAEALRRHRDGDFDLILPTIRNLEAIARFGSAADLLEAAAAIGEVPTIQPRVVVEEGGGVRILLPGDPGYADAGDALPAGAPLPGRSR
jgi:8-oxo-dGTP pyrophosphatase MutT (NUDIX family)